MYNIEMVENDHKQQKNSGSNCGWGPIVARVQLYPGSNCGWGPIVPGVQLYRVFKQQEGDFAAPYLWTRWMKLLKSFFPESLRLVHLWPVHF
mgnify:CR=1 FL=1